MADQLEPIQRPVALKLIKPGMDSRSVLARFEAERQALALMDHPNIARVLDAGTTADGRPYFVMELVKGTPITDFADARKLTPRQRLELFVPVCQAIQHAHLKGIIHRDIKPGNVLVELHDDRPVVKVIDFGVAKAIGQQLTEKSIYTGFGALVGTPAYMAPEQATFNALDVDTRADVYALGVLLYELLAGSPPIEAERLRKAALDEVLRLVRDEEPPRPSARLSTSEARASIAAVRGTEPAKLSALMKGELDWIVMKALEKDRARRYETANGFAADVQRYLAGEAVQAVPPSAAYRLKKAYRKHRGPVVGSFAIVMAMIAGITGATLGLIESRTQEGVARREAEAKEQAREAEADQRGIAEANERKAVERQKELDAKVASLSIATQFAADTAFAENRVARAKALLRQVPEKHRHFEWHYRMNQFTGSYATLYGHTGGVNSVAWSPDGRRIASGSDDGTVKIWDNETGAELLTLKGHAEEVYSVAWSPDGRRIASGSDDHTIRLWDAATGAERAVLKDHAEKVNSVAWSPDGRRIASSTSNNTVNLWSGESHFDLSGDPDWDWETFGRKHPTKPLWVHFEGDKPILIDLAVDEKEVTYRRGKAAFKRNEAWKEHNAATTPYAKAFWWSRFAINEPDAPHWQPFQDECTDPATWRLIRQTCDMVLQRGPNEHASRCRGWALRQRVEVAPPPRLVT